VSSKLLCKEIIRARKAKEKLFVAKAQLNSVGMQLQHQLGELFGWMGFCFNVARL
jgi:division protein CdvB (Snf7/Vps24/ESCRT-III family)